MSAERCDGPPQPRRDAEPWAFAAACLLVALLFQGTRGLFEPDEGRYAEAARGMLASGDFLVPQLHGEPHLTKPPGAYWLIAAGLALFGRNEFGARFFLGLAFAACAMLVRVIARGLVEPAAARRAGWIFLTMLFPAVAGNVLTTDMFLAAAELAAIACMVRAWDSPRPRRWLALSGAALGVAFLVKGPPALIPTGAFAVGRLLFARRSGVPARVASLGGAALFAAVGLWWFVWIVRSDPSLARWFLERETFERAFTTVHGRVKPWWFYAAVLVAGSLPWTWFCVRGAADARRLRGGVTFAAWIGITFLLFSLAGSKRYLYALPIAAPLAVLAAIGARRGDSPLPVRPAWLAAWLVLLAAGKFGAAQVATPRDGHALAAAVRDADPEGRLPVGLSSGRNMYGLDFHLEGRLLYLRSGAAASGRAGEKLSQALRRFADEGDDLLVVAEPGGGEEAVRRFAGERAVPVAAPEGWTIFRVRAE